MISHWLVVSHVMLTVAQTRDVLKKPTRTMQSSLWILENAFQNSQYTVGTYVLKYRNQGSKENRILEVRSSSRWGKESKTPSLRVSIGTRVEDSRPQVTARAISLVKIVALRPLTIALSRTEQQKIENTPYFCLIARHANLC